MGRDKVAHVSGAEPVRWAHYEVRSKSWIAFHFKHLCTNYIP